jgi:hypothetical protein
MPSRFYQNAINLIGYLPSSRYPSEFMNVAMWEHCDRLCGLVVRVLGYRSGGPGTIRGTTKKSSVSGTGSTQPREYK